MKPEQERGEACIICGRTLDSIIPTVEVELRGRLLRACEGQCIQADGAPVWLDSAFSAEQRVEFAAHAEELHSVLTEAREAGTVGVIDVVTMSLRVMEETRRVLGLDAPVKVELVTEPDQRIPDQAVMKIARDAAREYYEDD